MTISSGVMERVLAAAAASPHAEVCGLLFGTPDTIATAQPCTNVAADPARTFEIDPVALFAAHRRARAGGLAVIGHYHSHPSGQPIPSPRDAAQSMGDGAIWLIVGGGRGRLWRSATAGTFVEEPILPAAAA